MMRMRRIFAEERFDVIHVHEPYAPILSAFALAVAECPTVVTCHAAGEKLGWYPMGRRVWGVVLNRADHRIAVSESARRAAEPYVSGAMEVIPNGIALPDRFDPGGRNGNIVFIGRNERRKGLEVLLRAWPEIAAKTSARLRVVGADPLSVRWLARRQDLSLERVDLLGGLHEDDLTAEVEVASLLVAPALGGESFGMVLTRAFASATPAVASDIEGYAAVADEASAVLVPPGEPEPLAREVVALLEDEPRRRALGEGGRRVAEQYSWDRIARRLIEIYEEITVGSERERAAA
jgi:phosphatidylinositol alpha-mannosyltransferase